jgi:type I restriction enzyme, R subunit
MNKKTLSERDICSKFITPAIQAAGWDLQTQVREELTFTAGRVIVRGRLHSRGEKRRADYVLFHQKNQPIAVIEAKDNNHSIGSGMQQALAYAEALDVLFVFSSNGDGFLFHDKTGLSGATESELINDQFPSPTQLWQWYCEYKGIGETAKPIVDTPYYDDGTGRAPRYYQMVAVNRTVEAVAQGQQRILLVMATGTGKTYTAFQIIWRLWKSKQKKRILFLADRNILVDQTKNNDFKPFGAAMTKITNRTVNKAFEIYLSLYQAITGPDEADKIFREFSPDFFDLIIIDECHRGSAREDSAWREILEYFKSATHVGLTATPKETEEVSNIHYFGEPVFSYSLKQGIDDGFLAPYKVIRMDFDIDLQGWRPTKGQTDKHGNLIEDRIYNQKDMDRNIVFDERTYLVAKQITEYLQKTGEFQKTIVFCDDIDHAERMRQALVNLNPQRVKESNRYVMRITGDDQEGKAQLDNFINPEEKYPVIATTSKLMTTGVDAKTCKLVVLDQRIQSMTEFKQIIGRGTRIDEDYDKLWFTIMDFKKATELFADPAFDGDPVQIYQPKPGDDPEPPEIIGGDTPKPVGGDGSDNGGIEEPTPPYQPPIIVDPPGEHAKKFYIKGVQFKIIGKRVQHLGPDGTLITESLTDFTRQTVKKQYATLQDFFKHWTAAERKQHIIQTLAEQGVVWEDLYSEVKAKNGADLDAFDLISHLVYDQPPLTRRERANSVKKRNYFTKYQGAARQVLESLLDKYADTGIEHIEEMKILLLPPFDKMGAPIELLNAFGGKAAYQQAVQDLEQQLYSDQQSA